MQVYLNVTPSKVEGRSKEVSQSEQNLHHELDLFFDFLSLDPSLSHR